MTVGDGANDVRIVGASGARDVAESHLFTLNCCCEQQRRCGVAPVELLLRTSNICRKAKTWIPTPFVPKDSVGFSRCLVFFRFCFCYVFLS